MPSMMVLRLLAVALYVALTGPTQAQVSAPLAQKAPDANAIAA